MGLVSPCGHPWRVRHGAWRGGHALGLLVMLGLVVTGYAPLAAVAPPDRGGTIVGFQALLDDNGTCCINGRMLLGPQLERFAKLATSSLGHGA